MKPDLNNLLIDLYSADPTLKEHEKTLKPILKHLLAARPNAPIDEQFKAKLREEVWAQIEAIKQKPKTSLLLFPKWAYAASGAALMAVILVPTLIITLAAPSTEQIQSAPSGKGGGGGLRSLNTESAVTDEYAAIYPDYIPYTSFTYSYKGDPLVLDGSAAEVFTKTNNEISSLKSNNLLSDLDLNLINLEKFDDLKISYLNLEPKDGSGYSASIDLNNNTISMSYWDNTNWDEEWNIDNSNKKMSTDQAINITKKFIDKYDLDLSEYGEPIAKEQQEYVGWIESFMTVTYPIELNNLTLYEDWGEPIGVSFSISVADERIESFWGLSPQNYSSTLYDTISDPEIILEIAELGGTNGYLDPYANIVEIDLGTPFKGLTKVYNYDENSYEYSELIVPALIFPITEEHPDLYQDYIVVPLVEEFLNDNFREPKLLETEEAAG